MKLLAVAVLWVSLIVFSSRILGKPGEMKYSEAMLSYIALGVIIIVVELIWREEEKK